MYATKDTCIQHKLTKTTRVEYSQLPDTLAAELPNTVEQMSCILEPVGEKNEKNSQLTVSCKQPHQNIGQS